MSSEREAEYFREETVISPALLCIQYLKSGPSPPK